ncbi:MAG: Maf family protein [Desulfatiglandales bacterium]
MTPEFPLVLASRSPRRKEILKVLKIPFVVSPVDRSEKITSLSPTDYCTRLSVLKAKKGYEINRGRWVLGADTVVVLEGEILGKPSSPQEAKMTLSKLSGKTHEVITSIAIVNPHGELAYKEASTTRVTFKGLSEEEIDAYIRTGEPMDKAGAYAIQGIGAFMVRRLEGSYSNVVGLPIFELIQGLLISGALLSYP